VDLPGQGADWLGLVTSGSGAFSLSLLRANVKNGYLYFKTTVKPFY
jgi:hypothetical protein